MYTIAPHRILDNQKVASILMSVRSGVTLPPILVDENGQAYSGAHRLEAVKIANKFDKFCDLELSYVEISMDDKVKVLDHLGLDAHHDVWDFDSFVDAARELGLAGAAE